MKAQLEVSTATGTLLFLNPDEILRDEQVNVRPGWTMEGDMEGIEELAKSIQEVGQIQPIKIRRVLDESDDTGLHYFHLIAGRRRLAAIEYLNAQKSSKEEPLKVMAISSDYEVSEDSAFRQAMMENMKRKDFSPMDLARNIGVIRERHEWKGAKGTRKVAEYLGVSPAKVTTHESLLSLDEETQERVGKGELSAQAAFELLNVPVERRNEVMEEAQKGQNHGQDAQGGQLEWSEGGTDGLGGEIDPINDPNGKMTVRKKLPGKKAGKVQKVKAREVRAAARKTGASLSIRPLSRTEILNFFLEIKLNPSQAYGYANGAVHKFVLAFLSWAEGATTDQTMTKYWDLMVLKAAKGEASLEEKEQLKAGKNAGKTSGKSASKSASKPKPKK